MTKHPVDEAEQPHLLTQVKMDDPWDLSDPLNPQPLVYPVCAECHAPWNYSWAWVIGGKKGKSDRWCWTRPPSIPRGCKHKGRPLCHDTRTGETTTMPGGASDGG